eukprot:scaffold27082_cov148-Skeletonema_menzelii.AAC.2
MDASDIRSCCYCSLEVTTETKCLRFGIDRYIAFETLEAVVMKTSFVAAWSELPVGEATSASLADFLRKSRRNMLNRLF